MFSLIIGSFFLSALLALSQSVTHFMAYAADPVLVGAGDIASCSSSGDEATANLLDSISGTIFTLGDNAYDSGTTTEYTNCYNPTWGRHKARTFPAPGNHAYNTTGATGYYNYFGSAAGDPAKGYYSYDVGAWHIVVINSNRSQVGGCGAGSAQEQWLRSDLAAHPTACTLAYWHHPRFSSGSAHGSSTATQAIWQALYDFRADIVLVGHEHHYERFAPQDALGNLDTARGIREFVVGTGGKSHYGFGTILANSQVRNSDTYGVLKLTLRSVSYDWEFVPETGKTFTDTGSASCVTATSALFAIERKTGQVYADGAYFCQLSANCFNSGTGADLAEQILSKERLKPGDLVEVDLDNPKQYRKTRTAYGQAVAGVITTQPGVLIAVSKQAARAALALMGRVPVKATIENGPIYPGDLLVSASRPGYAMRCISVKFCEGAILGKALEALNQNQETGLITMLVMSH
jgi:hypothetical protein